MKLNSHIKQGAVLFPLIYYFWNIKTALLFTLGFIFIDVDHYFLFVYKRKSLSIKQMFEYFDGLWERRGNFYELCIFHTVEFFMVLYFLGYWHEEFWIILAGFFIHSLFDLYYFYKYRVIFIRPYSVIEYFIRKRNIKQNNI